MANGPITPEFDRAYWLNWLSQYMRIEAPTGWDAVALSDREKLEGLVDYNTLYPTGKTVFNYPTSSEYGDWSDGFYKSWIGELGAEGTKYFLFDREVPYEVIQLQEEIYSNLRQNQRNTAIEMLVSVGILVFAL